MPLCRAAAGAGKPIVDNCMGGYNSSIFAYGQTGAGKTYTMQGPLVAAAQDGSEQVCGQHAVALAGTEGRMPSCSWLEVVPALPGLTCAS